MGVSSNTVVLMFIANRNNIKLYKYTIFRQNKYTKYFLYKSKYIWYYPNQGKVFLCKYTYNVLPTHKCAQEF